MKNLIIANLVMSIVLVSFAFQKSQEDLIGKWNVGSVEYDNSKVMCNSCPQIEFLPDKKAVLTLPSLQTESYTWSVTDKSLIMEIDQKVDDEPYFTENNYWMNFEDKSNYIQLKLTTANGRTYSLGKVKTGLTKK